MVEVSSVLFKLLKSAQLGDNLPTQEPTSAEVDEAMIRCASDPSQSTCDLDFQTRWDLALHMSLLVVSYLALCDCRWLLLVLDFMTSPSQL